MAVDKSGLDADLLAFFSDPPLPTDECATAWADAMGAYAAGVVPPSTTVVAATATLEGAVESALNGVTTPVDMDTAFQAFAVTVFGGMPPPPPAKIPAPVGILFATPLATPSLTHAAGATKFADFIDTWFTSSGWT